MVAFSISNNCLAQRDSKSTLSKDSLKTQTLNQIIITASRVPESLLKSPVSIEKVSGREMLMSGSPSFFDAIANVKGVQMITASLGFKVINTRGFANPTNVRFVQLVDGVDNQAPHIGAPIGNAIGPNDLDLQSVEIIPGTASALFGMNAINGLANFQTKNPFEFKGVSFQQKAGINDQRLFTETAFRFAHQISTKWAFKINSSFIKGNDFVAHDQSDLSPNINLSAGLTGVNNPAYDPVNSYGNESSNRRTLSLNGKNYVVARTGYNEKDVVDYGLQNLKSDASVHYKPGSSTQISYTFRFARLDNVYQRSNRFRLQDYYLGQHSINFNSPILQFRAYQTSENTGKSYNLRSMAENLDRSFKNDDTWFSDFTSAFNQSLGLQQTVVQSLGNARESADKGRLQSGTTAFQTKLQELQDINNWDIGAALRVKAALYHMEGQVDINKLLSAELLNNWNVNLQMGFDHRTYSIFPDGNYFINPEKGNEADNILYSKTGGFLQATKVMFDEKLKVGATLRADKNDYFDIKVNPRITGVYTINQIHSLRASFQNGFRFPSVFEAFSNVNSGGVKRVGGLRLMSNGIFEKSYLRTSIDAFQAAVLKDVNSSGLSRDAAIKKNQPLLQKNNYTYLQPEKLRSFEWGYRGLLLKKTVLIDIDFYYNKYSSFVGQIEGNIPKTQLPDSIGFFLNDRKLQDRYRMWTNSKTVVYNYGGSAGLKFNLPHEFRLNGNVTYANLQKKTFNDGLEDGFNTPKWITNASLGNASVLKSFGFNLTHRWQSSFYWQSFLVNGNVSAFSTTDAQINYALRKLPVMIKAGGSNILNKRYHSFLGGPQIGSIFWTSITVNGI